MARVLVYDPKDDPAAEIPNAALVHTARDAMAALPGRVLYRPTGRELAHIADRFDEIAVQLARIQRATPRELLRPQGVVIHEVGDLCTERRIGPGFSELIRKGRSLWLTLILVSQRPQGIAVMVRSEAQHAVAFTLVDPSDRDAMAALMGPEVRMAPLPLDHSWWYRGPDLQLVLHAPLALGGQQLR